MVRLSLDAVPVNYKIRLEPDLVKFTFEAEETIELRVKSSTLTQLTLHALDLTIHKAELVIPGETGACLPASISLDGTSQTVTFGFDRALPVGPAELRLKYTGILNDRLAGFYRSKYFVGGQERYMAVTQFEATDARRALVCWDEPAVKATFDVVLVVPLDRLAISNTAPVKSLTDTATGKREVIFARTPTMSTYLLAFVVGEFDYLSCYSEEGTEVRVYTPLGKTHLGSFALRVASRALSYYVKLFDIPYPLPKMDLLAIPDFAAGAMENYGCITYREVALLIDEAESSLDRKQRVARTICHEIAHQWFGNMVTMEWWTHLWLNEGFARFLEFFAVDSLFPEWTIWAQFVSSIQGSALRLDSLETSHPIEVPVNHPDEINEIFDTISYAKGASIIRMLSDHLGTDVFFEGLHNYLLKHQWANASTEDLWIAFEDASGKQIREMMKTWTTQTGYPLLTVEKSGGGYSVSQSRYLSSGKIGQGSWSVPVSILTTSGAKVVGHILPGKGLEFQANGDSWMKLNPGQVGFYRVKYTDSQFEGLQKIASSLPFVERLGLFSDALALAKAGILPTIRVLGLLENFVDEQEHIVWSDMVGSIESFAFLYSHEPFYQNFRKFALSILSKIGRRLSLIGAQIGEEIAKVASDPLKMQFRSLIFDVLGTLEEETVVQYSKKAFALHYKNLVGGQKECPLVHPDLRNSVYSIVASTGKEQEFDMIWAIHQKTDLSEEKRRCLQALGKFEDEKLLNRLLALSLTADVRHQDISYPISSVSHNPKGKLTAWNFVKNNWDFFDENFNRGGQNFVLGAVVSAVSAVFVTQEMSDAVRAFFKDHPVPSAESSLRQALETVSVNSERLIRDRQTVPDWLAKH